MCFEEIRVSLISFQMISKTLKSEHTVRWFCFSDEKRTYKTYLLLVIILSGRLSYDCKVKMMNVLKTMPQLANFGQGVTACNLSQNEWSKVAAEKLQNNSFLLNSNFCTCSSLQMRVWIFEWNVSLMKLHFFQRDAF